MSEALSVAEMVVVFAVVGLVAAVAAMTIIQVAIWAIRFGVLLSINWRQLVAAHDRFIDRYVR